MRYKPFLYILPIAVLAIVWQACNEDDPSVNASRLRLKLTDATSLVIRELLVDIREISVFLADTASGEGEWTPLEFSGGTYDILKLMNGKTVQLVDQYVPAGTELQQIRLMLGNNSRFITNTDDPYPLQTPPELLDGVVIDAEKMEMRLNTISSMIIDLNAALSVREENGTYFLHPVARAFPETYGGKLRGSVSPLMANPFIAVIQDEDTLLTYPERNSPGDHEGSFQFIGLGEGDWEVHMIAGPESGYQDSVFVSTIEAGETETIALVRLKPLSGE